MAINLFASQIYLILGTKNWLIKKILDDEVSRCIKKYAFGVMLDIGCGLKPYMNFSQKFVSSYIGLDHWDSPHGTQQVDVISNAYQIPLPSNSIDTILCTEVLEHLEEPSVAIQEAYRLLRKNGVAIYTVPFSWPIHEGPRDFYRYSEYGLRYLFEKAGFKVEEIRALDGLLVKLVQPACYALWGLRKGGVFNPLWWVIPPLTSILQVSSFYFNKRSRKDNSPNTDHYSIVVSK